MKRFLFILICLGFAVIMPAASLNEGFTSTSFPPAGWSVINAGNPLTWQHSSLYQHNAYGSARIVFSGSGAQDDWFITPQLSPTTGNASFSLWAYNWSHSIEYFNVKLSTTTSNQADFTVTLASNLGPISWTQYTYNLSTYIGQNVYIAIQAISAYSTASVLYLDDISGPSLTGYEGFESNNFSSWNWDNSSAVPWTTQSAVIHSGSYAAKSGAIADDSSTSLTLTRAGLVAGSVSFYKKLDTEEHYDYLRFYIDDVEQGTWSGFSDWTLHSYPVTAGSHTFRWTYSKDSGYSEGSDCAWIDDIIIPPVITGTESNPIQIYDFTQLNNLRNFLGATHSGKYYKLMNDIDASPTSTSNWVPIGNSSSYFYGNFDGDGHSISNLRLASYGTYHGLFGYTASGSMIKNLSMGSGCFILGDAHTGSIVGYNAGSIENCSSAATVNIGNASNGGGIVGTNPGTVSYCTFTGTVSRSADGVNANALGGIVGSNGSSGTVSRCKSSANISGSLWTGGIAGWNDGSISMCESTGSISAYSNSNGGLVGQNNSNISNSYSRCNVSGAQNSGGLVGNHGNGTISNSYSTGTVAGNPRGGLIGARSGTVTNSFWDTQTSGIATSYGGTGKTTLEMQTQSTFTGWDFTRETANGTNDYWTIWPTDNNGYPELFWKHATEFRAPVLISPADLATNMPVAGFELSWDANPVGILPSYYNVYMMRYTSPGVMEEHLFPQLTGTSFYPVVQGGLTLYHNDTWYWTVEAASWAGTVRTLPLRSLQIEPIPVIDTFPYLQTFASATFPPVLWDNAGWYLHDANGYGATGTGSVQANFWDMDPGTSCDLITADIDTHGLPAILSFDHAYATYEVCNDKLEIWYSTDSGLTYNLFASYNGGVDGPLVTAPPQNQEFVPSASQWATKSIALPSGTIKLKFHGVSDFGNNLYLDNITLSTANHLVHPANVRVFVDEASATYELRWDNSAGAAWYGVYAGQDPLNPPYLGWTDQGSIGFTPADKLFFRVSAGSGTPIGTDLGGNIR